MGSSVDEITARSTIQESFYCCEAKKYYSSHQNLSELLEIIPRMMIYHRKLKIKSKYTQTVKIQNNGLYPRLLKYFTDSPDTTFKVVPDRDPNKYLESSESIKLNVTIRPTTEDEKGYVRHLFIEATHPNIIFEIPIIVEQKVPMPIMPSVIKFPSSIQETVTSYQFLLYNSEERPIHVTIKPSKHFSAFISNKVIRKASYVTVLVQVYVTDTNLYKKSLKMKFDRGSFKIITLIHHPALFSDLYLSQSELYFETVRFERETKRQFIICNESEQHMEFRVKFLKRPTRSITEEFEEVEEEEKEEEKGGCTKHIENTDETDKELSVTDNTATSQHISATNQTSPTNLCSEYDYEAYKHFILDTSESIINPKSALTISIIFHPNCDADTFFEDHLEPPYKVSTKLIFNAKHDAENEGEEKPIYICGYIQGLEVDIRPKSIDFRKVYCGEEHCAYIKITNLDGILPVTVKYESLDGDNFVTMKLTPEEVVLKPCATEVFHFAIYTDDLGKFQVFAIFKVRNGPYHKVTLRGHSQVVRVRAFPDSVQMGIIPVAVPQQRLILVVNPLAVPVVLQCTPDDDGSETPLVLKIDDVNGLLPINIDDPVHKFKLRQMEEKLEKDHLKTEEENDNENEEEIIVEKTFYCDFDEENNEEQEDEEEDKTETPLQQYTSSVSLHDEEQSDLDFIKMDRSSLLESPMSFKVDSDNTSFSSRFEEEVLFPMENMAHELIQTIKIKRYTEKKQAEKNIISEAMFNLLNIDYFEPLDLYKNYMYMNWNELPSDPKEIYCDNEQIHLLPNTGKYIAVMVIPNNIGYSYRAIKMRVCPIEVYNAEAEPTHLVDSHLMTVNLMVEFQCQVPTFIWSDIISFEEKKIYAGEEYEFNMRFENDSSIGGFVFYDVIPNCESGVMRFTNNIWRFYIAPANSVEAECAVTFLKVGEKVKLSGLVGFLGNIQSTQFHIIGNVEPSRIKITPLVNHKRCVVLKTVRIYIFIDNITPTTTRLTFSLLEDTDYKIEPKGAALAPTGQGIYVMIEAKFLDPEYYKNILYIQMQYGPPKHVPITFLVEEMPIIFEPDIKDGIDLGIRVINSIENYNADIPICTETIKVLNLGRRPYRIEIQKIRNKSQNQNACKVSLVLAHINIDPKNLILDPGSRNWIYIDANSCEVAELFNEFRITIVDQTNRKRFQNILLNVKVKFIQPELLWSKNEICMEYNRTHRFLDNPHLDQIQLLNIAVVTIEVVNLKIVGPFKIKEFFEHKFQKEIEFPMFGLEKKEFTVVLDKTALRDKTFRFTEGRILCTADSKPQKSVHLIVHIFKPDLIITQPDIVLFTHHLQSDTLIELQNIGSLDAQYKWRKIVEKKQYVGEHDDAREIAYDLLSDIFRLLDIGQESDTDEESVYGRNLTLRYQKYRCRLRRLEDPIGIMEIIDQIIENLDLEHKRYIIKFDEDKPAVVANSSIDYLAEEETEEVVEETSDFENEQKNTVEVKSLKSESSDNPEKTVKRTLNEILGKIKIEDSYDQTDPSSEHCYKDREFYFYEKNGVVTKETTVKTLLHLPAVHKGFEISATFELDVFGGENKFFNITLVNLARTIELSRTNIYLGMRPWYEIYKANVTAHNVTQYEINIKLEVDDDSKKKRKRCCQIVDGYVVIATEKHFNITMFDEKKIKTSGIMGFSEEFIREIIFVVNDSEEVTLRLRGQGVMPILTVTSKMQRIEQDQAAIADEYRLLQRVYYFDIFKSITEEEERELPKPQAEEDSGKSEMSFADFSDFSLISASGTVSTARSSGNRTADLRFFKMMKTYVIVHNNADLPNATVLEQLLETERFLKRVRENPEVCALAQQVFEEHEKLRKSYDEKLPIYVKYFTTQPLPCELHGYILNMRQLKLGQFHRFTINLTFFGPGKLIASVRTAVYIPDLFVHFEIEDEQNPRLSNSQQDERKFAFYKNEMKAPDLYVKPYRNMYERIIDEEEDPKLRHAHSYDVDNRRGIHKREVSLKDRKQINNYYNSLNKSIYVEQKHHFILSKIMTKSLKNYADQKFFVNVVIKPTSKYYEEGQVVTDYLYIDLHMGPTLPILLRGVIAKR